MGVKVEVFELRHPLVVAEDRAQEVINKIKNREYFAPVLEYVNPNMKPDDPLDVTPEALRQNRERYMLLVSREGKGRIQISHSQRKGDHYDVDGNGWFYFKNTLSEGYGEGDGRRYFRLYEIIDLTNE